MNDFATALSAKRVRHGEGVRVNQVARFCLGPRNSIRFAYTRYRRNVYAAPFVQQLINLSRPNVRSRSWM